MTNEKPSVKSSRPLNEKIVYRSNKVPNKSLQQMQDTQQAECPSCHSILPLENIGDQSGKVSRASAAASAKCNSCARNSAVSRSESPRRRVSSRSSKLNKYSVDWTQLGEKIEDWFHYADSAEQNVVFNFLKDIKEEDEEPKTNPAVKSLENILDNLKRYRSKDGRALSRSANFPKLGANNNSNANQQLYESSSWRVMRQLRSADLRNKYPVLPKANPDSYFHHSSVFYLPHRVPKSTFLLHPEWV